MIKVNVYKNGHITIKDIDTNKNHMNKKHYCEECGKVITKDEYLKYKTLCKHCYKMLVK